MEIEINSKNHIKNSNIENLKEIPVVSSEISYNDFFHNYMLNNIPCIIKNISNKWESSVNWFKGNEINFSYLKELYGKCDVTAYNCKEKYFNSHKTQDMLFKDYLEYFEKYTTSNEDMPLNYLKDWHLKNTFPNDKFYKVPKYFASDWLNEYLIENLLDDYRFVYMGPKCTWTPFHADVFNSFSWSVNIFGKKRWVLFPPREENNLRDSFNNLPFDVTEINLSNQKYLEILQNSNEAIFVPSGWHHQVWNLENTISINHNWVNGCNIENMWLSMVKNLELIKEQIEDCSDMDNFLEHCQVMLNASYGMDFYKFYDLLFFISSKRIASIKDNKNTILFDDWILGETHILFDIKALKSVLEKFIKHDDINKLNKFNNLNKNPENLLNEIIKFC